MRSSLRIGLAVAVLCLAPYASLAAAINPVSQTRSITASASHPSGTPTSSTQAAPDFAEFSKRATANSGPASDRTTVFIQQRSQFDEQGLHLVVDGLALFGVLGEGSASSIFDVSFDLPVESEYELHYNGLVTAFAARAAPSRIPRESSWSPPVTELTGVLAAGRYRLEIFANGRAAQLEDDGRIHQHIDLHFMPIPEPSTAALIAAGFALLRVARGSARRG